MVKSPPPIVQTATASFAEVRRLFSALRIILSPSHICAPLCHAWSRCLTGRIFGLTVWATVAVALLIPTPPAPVQAATLTADIYSSPGPEQMVATTIVPADESGLYFTMDEMPQGGVASREDLEMLTDCWGASQMQVQEAWQAAGPLETVLVAVLDTGIDVDNPHLCDRVVASVAVIDTSGVDDVFGHGTHIASTITTIAPNSLLLNIKVADDRGFCHPQDVAEAIRLAANRGAAVINLSLQVESSSGLEAAVEYAWGKGAVLVAAAGMPVPNSSAFQGLIGMPVPTDGPCRPPMSPPIYPAFYAHTIAVTGTNEYNELAPVSNRAEWVDVAAPGYRTFSDMPDGERGYLTGTSTATAHVAGLAALLYGLAEDKNGDGRVNDEVRRAIEATAEPLAVEGTGSGIVNALAAVAYLSA